METNNKDIIFEIVKEVLKSKKVSLKDKDIEDLIYRAITLFSVYIKEHPNEDTIFKDFKFNAIKGFGLFNVEMNSKTFLLEDCYHKALNYDNKRSIKKIKELVESYADALKYYAESKDSTIAYELSKKDVEIDK